MHRVIAVLVLCSVVGHTGIQSLSNLIDETLKVVDATNSTLNTSLDKRTTGEPILKMIVIGDMLKDREELKSFHTCSPFMSGLREDVGIRICSIVIPTFRTSLV